MTPEQLAEKFHNVYEELAPSHGYETRKESAVPWANVPEKNKSLMTAVCKVLLSTCQELSIETYSIKAQRDRLAEALKTIGDTATAALDEIDPKHDYSSCTGPGEAG